MKNTPWSNKNTDALIQALLSLKTADQARRFLRDLMTETELIEFGNRWKAARMLSDGKIYTEINRETGLSSRTIARISKWLTNGKGGYLSLISTSHHHAHHINSSQGTA